MLKKRLIPKLLIKKHKLGRHNVIATFTSKKFLQYVPTGNPVDQAKIFESQMADELIVIDLEKEITNYEKIKIINQIAKETFMPLCVGGGVKTLKDISKLLFNGADKVVINSLIRDNPKVILKAAKKFGSQCLIGAIDFKNDKFNKPKIYDNKNKKILDIGLIQFLTKIKNYELGEILITDIDKDGTGKGMAIELYKKINKLIKVPLLISGGCGVSDHIVKGFKEAGADGVVAGTFFSNRDQNLLQLRSALFNAKLNVRKIT